jgi:hypothetical protein
MRESVVLSLHRTTDAFILSLLASCQAHEATPVIIGSEYENAIFLAESLLPTTQNRAMPAHAAELGDNIRV